MQKLKAHVFTLTFGLSSHHRLIGSTSSAHTPDERKNERILRCAVCVKRVLAGRSINLSQLDIYGTGPIFLTLPGILLQGYNAVDDKFLVRRVRVHSLISR